MFKDINIYVLWFILVAGPDPGGASSAIAPGLPKVWASKKYLQPSTPPLTYQFLCCCSMLCCCCFGILGGILFIFLLVYGFLVSFLLLAFFSVVSFAAVCFGIVGWAPYFICCNSLPFSALLVLGTWNICSFKKKLAFSPFQNTLYEWASFYFRHRASKFVGTALCRSMTSIW